MTPQHPIRRTAPAPLHTLLATGLLATAMAAQAETTVQIYGIVDTGIQVQNKTAGSNDGRVSMNTSNLRQSVWGLRGSEDLGNGLKAFFNLESHIAVDTGGLFGDGQGESPLFRRQANVGLSGSWGSVTLGRQYGPALLAHVATEPRAFKEQFSSLYTWAYNQLESINGGGANNTNDDVGIFMKNAIQYRGSYGPVTGGILYALGEQAGDTSANSILALGLTYTGPVTLSFSHEYMKDANTGEKVVEHTGLGAAVSLGDWAFKGNFHRSDNSAEDGSRVSKVDVLGLGVDWKWNPNNMVTVAYYDARDKENRSNHTKNLVIGNETYLSKRTTLYATLAMVDADTGATGTQALRTSIVNDASFRAGSTTSFFNFGIHHNF